MPTSTTTILVLQPFYDLSYPSWMDNNLLVSILLNLVHKGIIPFGRSTFTIHKAYLL